MATEGKKTEQQPLAHDENSPMNGKIKNKSLPPSISRRRSFENRLFLQLR